MLFFSAALVSFFGQGSWECIHQYDYPEDNVREKVIGHIEYEDDLSYASRNELIYLYLDSGEVFAKFTFEGDGRAIIQDNDEFYLDGRSYNFSEIMNANNHLPDNYIAEVEAFYNKELSIYERTLKVVKRSATHMDVLNEPSGTTTKCQAIPERI